MAGPDHALHDPFGLATVATGKRTVRDFGASFEGADQAGPAAWKRIVSGVAAGASRGCAMRVRPSRTGASRKVTTLDLASACGNVGG